MEAAVRSDVGMIREINEDHVFLSEVNQNGLTLAIVADGMGGHLAGEVASKLAVETIVSVLETELQQERTVEEYSTALEKAIHQANTHIYQNSIGQDNYRGMGTTVVAAIVSEHWIILGYVGDSRAYIAAHDEIKQLTSDHSLVNELLKSGEISEDEAKAHPQKNVLTRALGTDDEVKVDLKVIHWEEDQTLILCSDGLSNRVSNKEMLEISLQESLTVNDVADHFIKKANDAGGEDNISIVIVRHG